MADISLRDYLSNLDALLTKGTPSEVIHHCRHILQYFPKNAESYRTLGRALFSAGSWEEAGEVFRRVLSVYPDDNIAHTGLSAIYLNLKRPDEAIWHLERAFEQDPNNQPILDKLRELYRKHRKTEHAKVQLTTGAVARQYTRNGLYEQAIDTLQEALQRTPDRVDLRLLLATTFRELGYRVEAAEVALDVLKVLPDCLEANRMLTELWLAEQRPSDAQRYLNHIQSVEPYLALEIAQGEAVPDDAFKLEELDYRRAAERELSTQSPDWLMDIDQTATSARTSAGTSESDTVGIDDSTEWLGSFAPVEANSDDELPKFNDDFSTDLPDDWLTEIADVPAPSTLSSSKKTGRTGLLSQINDPEEAEPEPEINFEVDDLFPELAGVDTAGDFAVDEAPDDEVPLDIADLFGEESTDLPEPATPRQTGAVKNVDPLAWLHESGIEIVDPPENQDDDLFDAEDAHLGLQDADAVNPMAWLEGYGGDEFLTETATQENIQSNAPNQEMAASDDDDPLAWLNASEGEPAISNSTDEADEGVDPLDWLADESLLDEALRMEDLVESPVDDEVSNSTASSVERQDNMSDEHDDNLDWLSSADSEPEGDTLPDWLTEMPVGETTPTADDDAPESVSEMQSDEDFESVDMPDWLSDVSPELEPEDEDVAQPAANLEWLSQTDDDEEQGEFANLEPAQAMADSPDWLSDVSPELEPDDDEEQGEFADLEPAQAMADTPDWLSDVSPELEPDDEDVAQPAANLEWLSQPDDDEEQGEFADLEPAQAMADTPDWLSDVSPELEPDDEEVAQPAANLEWLSQTDDDEEQGEFADLEPAQAMADTPDWLSDVSPELEPDDEEVAQPAANLEWLSQTDDDEEQGEFADLEPAQAMADTPDWLSDVSPELEPEDDDEEAEFADLEPGQAIADSPDWLSDVSPELEPEDDSEAEPAANLEWLSQPDDDEEAEFADLEPGQAIADTPDWLSDVSPELEPEDDDEAQPAANLEWLSQTDDDEEADEAEFADLEPAQATADTPDWLSDVSPELEPEDDDEAQPAANLEWLSQPNDEEEAEFADLEPASGDGETESGDDLTIIEGIGEATAEALRMAGISTFAQIAELTPEELHQIVHIEQQVPMVVNTTESWPKQAQYLVDGDVQGFFTYQNSLVAGREPHEESVMEEEMQWETPIDETDEEQPQEESEFEWISEAALEATDVEDMPDWMNEMSPEDEGEVASEDELVADAPDWLSSVKVTPTGAQTMRLDELEDEVYSWESEADESGAEPEEALPDWLNNIQSQQQSDAIPEPVDADESSEFSWIDDINAPVEVHEPVTDYTMAEADEADDAFNFDDSEDSAIGDESSEEDMPVAPEPANNAPDWLNAMVPGLDVDYDAPEDEPIEDSFIEISDTQIDEVAPIRNRREFDWLTTIVDEETQQVSPIQDTRRRRFMFSRQPAWLRKPTEARDTAPKGDSKVVDEEMFDDDVDVPPWLQ